MSNELLRLVPVADAPAFDLMAHSPPFSARSEHVRKVAARSTEALVEAIGAALSTVTAEDARGFFEYTVRQVSHYETLSHQTFNMDLGSNPDLIFLRCKYSVCESGGLA